MADEISFAQGMQIMAAARQAMQTGPAAAPATPPPAAHQSVISPEQAHALQLLWLVTGQDGESVGRGFVTPSTNGDSNGKGIDRQVGGPAGDGDAPAVA